MKPQNPFLPGAGPLDQDSAASTIEWSARSQSGSRKPVNDDSWLAFSSDLKGANLLQPEGSHSLLAQDLIFAVSDGMGGGNAGDAASKLLLKNCRRSIHRCADCLMIRQVLTRFWLTAATGPVKLLKPQMSKRSVALHSLARPRCWYRANVHVCRSSR